MRTFLQLIKRVSFVLWVIYSLLLISHVKSTGNLAITKTQNTDFETYYLTQDNPTMEQMYLSEFIDIDNVSKKSSFKADNQTQTDEEKFYKLIENTMFTGTWKSKNITSFFDNQSGNLKFIFRNQLTILSTFFTKIDFVSRILDGGYIDKWLYIKTTDSNSVRTHVNFTNKEFSIFGLNVIISHGEINDKLDGDSSCGLNLENGVFEMNNDKSKFTSIKGDLVSVKCGLYLYYDSAPEDTSKENFKYIFYSVVIVLVILSQFYGAYLINRILLSDPTFSQHISIFSAGQNVIWNVYGCLCHFFLAVSSESYVPHFGIPAFLLFANFAVFELRLMYTIWRNQFLQGIPNPATMRKKLIKFYLIFYVFLFLSLFFVTKFYFEEPYIVVAVSLTWIPQIIHNIVKKNNISIPIYTILSNSINKIIYPLYFRVCPANFMNTKTSGSLGAILISVMVIEIVFMYLQSVFGPLYFLPSCLYKQNTKKHYFNKKELIKYDAEIAHSECIICISSLVPNPEDLKSTIGSEDFGMSLLNSVKSSDSNHQEHRDSCFYECLNSWKSVFYNFHKPEFCSKSDFVLTDCNHFFHKKCLETWMKQKLECPTCRTLIEYYQS